ncbi:MAG TPA: sigma 54-interacting transcriptional regulator [Pyrinomonadaceae bacterium]
MAQISTDPQAQSDLLARAQEFQTRGDLTGAQKLLQELLAGGAAAPDTDLGLKARVALAEACEGLGLFAEAGGALSPYDVHGLEDYSPHARGLVLLAKGSLAYWENDFPRSVTLLNRAREVLEPSGDAAGTARVLHCLGRAYWALDEQGLAREHYELAIDWGRRARQDRALAITYMNLGLVARQEGDADEARMFYRRAQRLLRASADGPTRARLQINLGVLLLYQGDFAEASKAFRGAFDHLAGYASERLFGAVNNNLALAAIHTGDWAAAEAHSRQALEIARACGDRFWEGEWTETLGLLRAYQGRALESEELLQFALARAREMGSKRDEAQAHLSLSRLRLSTGDANPALASARAARDIAREIKDERLACESALVMVEGHWRAESWGAAQEWAETARAELEPLSYPYLDAILQRNTAALQARHDASRGDRLFLQAEDSFRSMGANHLAALTALEHGESLLARGEHRAAHERLASAAERLRAVGAVADAERAEALSQRAQESIPARAAGAATAFSAPVPDAASLVLQVLNSASGRERLLRELMFAARSAAGAEAAAVFAADDDGQTYAQASVDLDERGRERAARKVVRHLAGEKDEKAGRGQPDSRKDSQVSNESGAYEICRTLSQRRGGGAFVLYLRGRAGLSERRAEILDSLVGCARLGLQIINLKSDARRARPFNAAAAPAASAVFPGLIASSHAMLDVLARMERLKNSDAPVLILGASGTGKEVVARALHDAGPRRDKIFLPFNCTAAPRDLVESQLFGHRRGTFTGAVNDQPGIIRAAEGGTLFLDEIGDLSAEVQPKLLRFLQGGEIMPLGEAPRKVNVRVVAATNRDLDRDVREGRFREDLFYRLNTFVIKLPPLRERADDVPLLAAHYFEEFCRRYGRELAGITPEAMDYLTRYRWPGNVRQLRSEVERIVVFAEDGQEVGAESLSPEILRAAAAASPVRFELDFNRPVDFRQVMLDAERQLIRVALARHGGNVTRAAESLGLSRQTMTYKLRKFHIPHPPDQDEEV